MRVRFADLKHPNSLPFHSGNSSFPTSFAVRLTRDRKRGRASIEDNVEFSHKNSHFNSPAGPL